MAIGKQLGLVSQMDCCDWSADPADTITERANPISARLNEAPTRTLSDQLRLQPTRLILKPREPQPAIKRCEKPYTGFSASQEQATLRVHARYHRSL